MYNKENVDRGGLCPAVMMMLMFDEMRVTDHIRSCGSRKLPADERQFHANRMFTPQELHTERQELLSRL